MAWKYSQATGVISHDGNSLTPVAYSGIGPGKNNPSAQMQESIGPIPRGAWTIGQPFTHPHAGPYTLRLSPEMGTVTFGRSGFLIHGDSSVHPGQASNGCIITGINNRQHIWASGDHTLIATQ
ncbi:tlde1 domain-containing protein [Paraburkholderia phytofirmans]|uniref:DUF2778 domain-containing protein n=1 Tax=Paraburkholderia phytofirmans TaxID=261302 RepID=A0ABW9BKX6_9BURK